MEDHILLTRCVNISNEEILQLMGHLTNEVIGAQLNRFLNVNFDCKINGIDESLSTAIIQKLFYVLNQCTVHFPHILKIEQICVHFSI